MNISVNGIDLHYEIDGRPGAPWVTFITGIANDTTMWDGQIEALADDFSILRFDLRGHGGSGATDGEYSLDLLTSDLLGLWDGLDIERSNLVGLGLGGALAIGLGTQYSDRLVKLAPCCCRAVMTPEFAAMWPGFVETVKKHGMEGMVEPTVQRWFTDEFKAANPQILDKVRAMIRSTDPRGYFGCIAAFMTLDYTGGLADISVPTLFISGADDHIGGPSDIMAPLADAVAGARHIAIPDAAHIANIQNRDGFNQVLGDFLRA